MTCTTSPPRMRCSCHGSCQTGSEAWLARSCGRMRHGLPTKYVDACRAGWALAGDYSPKDGRECAHAPRISQPLRCAHGTVDTKTVRLSQRLAATQMGLDQRWVAQEGIGDQAQFAVAGQMARGPLEQRLAGLIAGVHPVMKGRIADDRSQFERCR